MCNSCTLLSDCQISDSTLLCDCQVQDFFFAKQHFSIDFTILITNGGHWNWSNIPLLLNFPPWSNMIFATSAYCLNHCCRIWSWINGAHLVWIRTTSTQDVNGSWNLAGFLLIIKDLKDQCRHLSKVLFQHLSMVFYPNPLNLIYLFDIVHKLGEVIDVLSHLWPCKVLKQCIV